MNTLITLQELIKTVADANNDMVPGLTTSSLGASHQIADTGKAGRRPNHWQHSEIIFEEPDATVGGLTGDNPFVVTGYNNGIFTLDHDFGPAGAPSGLPFFIVRNHGQGTPYRGYLRAIRRALNEVGSYTEANVVLPVVEDTYVYAVTGLDTVHTVQLYDAETDDFLGELRPDQWEIPGDGTLRLMVAVSAYTVQLYGRTFGSMPSALDESISVDLEEVVDTALEVLFRQSNRQVDQLKGQNLQAERIRHRRRYARPNERLLRT